MWEMKISDWWNIGPCTRLSVVISHYHSLPANMRNEDIRLIECPSLYMLTLVMSHYHSLPAYVGNKDIRLVEYPSLYMLIRSYKSLSFTAR